MAITPAYINKYSHQEVSEIDPQTPLKSGDKAETMLNSFSALVLYTSIPMLL
jgi:hypothetical protein